jgi:hypothetical protein
MNLEGSLPCSQEPITSRYPEPYNPSVHPSSVLLYFNILLSYAPRTSNMSLFLFWLSYQNCRRIFGLSYTCYMTHHYHLSWFDRTNLVTSRNFEAPHYVVRRLLRRIYCLCLQGDKQASRALAASKNVGEIVPGYTALHLRGEYSP